MCKHWILPTLKFGSRSRTTCCRFPLIMRFTWKAVQFQQSSILLAKIYPRGVITCTRGSQEVTFLFSFSYPEGNKLESFAPIPEYNERFARQYRCEPPRKWHLSGPDTRALTRGAVWCGVVCCAVLWHAEKPPCTFKTPLCTGKTPACSTCGSVVGTHRGVLGSTHGGLSACHTHQTNTYNIKRRQRQRKRDKGKTREERRDGVWSVWCM